MAKDIEPIDADFDDVARKMLTPAPPFLNNTNALVAKSAQTPAPPQQLPLDLGIEVEKVIGGVEMGVLQNGIPYLTQTGLAEVCGAARSTVFEVSQEWEEAMRTGVISPRSRVAFFHDYLAKNGYSDPRLFIEITRNGSPYYAYPDVVCMAFVEYFAFEAQKTNATALTNYRQFARFGLQEFIYKALNYAPADKWALYHARVSLLRDSVPVGYFSIFKESAGLTADLINAGLTVNEHTIQTAVLAARGAGTGRKCSWRSCTGRGSSTTTTIRPSFPRAKAIRKRPMHIRTRRGRRFRIGFGPSICRPSTPPTF